MKRSTFAYLISAGALMGALAPAASWAQAWDGQVRFTGRVTDVTCKVDGQSAGSSYIKDVVLGDHVPSLFTGAAIGDKVGTGTPFSILLSECSAITGQRGASIAFATLSNAINTATENLKITSTSPAQGVEIGIWNDLTGSNMNKVPLGKAEPNPQTITWDTSLTPATNGGELKFRAYYVKTATTVTSGSGASEIGFMVAYR